MWLFLAIQGTPLCVLLTTALLFGVYIQVPDVLEISK